MTPSSTSLPFMGIDAFISRSSSQCSRYAASLALHFLFGVV